MAIDLQPMVAGGAWLQPNNAEATPTYVTHQSHITRLTLDGWRPVEDPRSELMARQAAQKTAEETRQQQEEQDRKDREEAQAKEIADLKAMVQSLLAATKADPKAEDTNTEENKRQTARRKAE